MRVSGLVTMAAVFWIQEQDVKGAGCWELARVPLEVRSHCFCGFVAGLERYRVSLIIQKYSQLFKIQIQGILSLFKILPFYGKPNDELQTKVTMRILYLLEMPLCNQC